MKKAPRKIRITQAHVERVQTKDATFIVWDTEIKGFGLRVTPTGRKSYVLKYRLGTGRSAQVRKPTLGPHPEMLCGAAREMAAKWKLDAYAGNDPSKERQDTRSGMTMGELWDRHRTMHVDVKLKPRSAKEAVDQWERLIKPRLGRDRVQDIGAVEVQRLHAALSATPYQANRVLALLSILFNNAERWGLRIQGSNPCRYIERYPERPRERALNSDEVRRLMDAVDHYAVVHEKLADVVRLALLTGMRQSEILSLAYSDVDFINSTIRLKDSKTGPRSVFVGQQALSLISHRMDDASSQWVFPGKTNDAAMSCLPKMWRKIRKRAGLDDVRFHDLRHTFATVGARSGISGPMLQKLLGHAQIATTERYLHLNGAELTKAADETARALFEMH